MKLVEQDELKILLALMGNQRIPHLEEEIFADGEATTLYLHNLCKEYKWYAADGRNEWLAYYYASDILNTRWPEAEAVIATSPGYAYYYAKDVIEGRWPEAEAVIATDPFWKTYYDLEIV